MWKGHADIPVADSQKKDNQKILDIGANHEKLTHGPVDHFHDAINEVDPQRHQTIEDAQYDSGDQKLYEKLGIDLPFSFG
jgi:hypothetical protein